MHDIVIIGSGVAGIGAALELSDHGHRPIILDVGFQADYSNTPIQENLYDYCINNDSFDLLVGNQFQGLYNFWPSNKPRPVKLNAPRMEFVTKESESLSPIECENFVALQSFATGGLANAWGAGLYRFNDEDLKGFPISEAGITKYYEKLTQEIGISGDSDDLNAFFGSTAHLLPPLELSENSKIILRKYQKKRDYFNKKGLYLGRPRLGVLSKPYNDREGCNYANMEFWQPNLSYLYSPRLTLNKLIQQDKVDYRDRVLVTSWCEKKDGIHVSARHLKDGQSVTLVCKKLILAAGAINTTKIVLASFKDVHTELALLDNPAIQFPLFFLSRIGMPLEKEAFGLTQLNLIYESKTINQRVQGSLLELTSPARAEFYSNFPFCATMNLKMIKYILPSMMALQIFLPGNRMHCAKLKLKTDNELKISHPPMGQNTELVAEITKMISQLGAFSHSTLAIFVQNGLGIHYSGTLPMVHTPQDRYQCHSNGLLSGTNNVYIVDASILSELPAKNSSLFIMGNSMRIAEGISRQLRESQY